MDTKGRGMTGSNISRDSLSSDDLAQLESTVSAALKTRDLSGLNIIGFGEVSVALGVPADNPSFVCKRTPPLKPAQFDQYKKLVIGYIDELRVRGLDVVETKVRSVDRDGQMIAYLVQPVLAAETLGNHVLASAEPDADHAFLVALSETIGMATPRLSIDAQVTNWSWSDGVLTLLDVGSPFIWDEMGTLEFDMSPFLPMIPAPLRSTIRKELTTMIDRWKQPRGVAVDVVANLYREGLEDWVAPMLIALNRTIGPDEPIVEAEAKAVYHEDLKTWPKLTKLKRAERAWQTIVRRRPYDFFIQSTYEDESQTY